MAADPSLDAFAALGPTDSRITAEALTLTARTRGEPKFLPVDASEALAGWTGRAGAKDGFAGASGGGP